MKKFSSFYQEKKDISDVKIASYKKIKKYFVLSTTVDPVLAEDFLLTILRSYSKFPLDDAIILRKKVPFYTAEVRDFIEWRTLDYLKQIPIFCWIFVFALCGVTDEKI
ncbi:MAG: hypothetical protein LWW95_08190 [Candidatus Desulfofervidus auxilii]|nr:hypothetical protein [Candidatus Desulfofervidus auxilii]